MSREFNFDELDKAVNSLIGKTDTPDQSQQPASANAVPAVQPQSSTAGAQQPPASGGSVPSMPARPAAPLSSRNVPAMDRPAPTLSAPLAQTASAAVQAPVQQAAPQSPPKPPVEKPSVPGRFMDVVHPAANMATPAKEDIRKGMGAEGRTVTPLSSNIAPDPLPERSAANTPNSAQLSMQGEVNPDAMITTPDTEEKKWKDPLDEAAKNEKDRSIKEQAQERLGPTPKVASEELEAGDSEEKKPLFLPDAKVEKRPLGAFAETDKSDSASKDDASGKKESPAKLTIDGIDDMDTDKKDDSQDSFETLPPELGKEIVAVEAGGSIADELESEKEKEATDAKKKDKKEDLKKNHTAQADAKSATFSIPKQYTEKTTPADNKPKSIYDTEEYHRSLATAASKKKKSKWWVWVLIVLGLLVIGVGAGAGVYFFVQP